MAVAFAFSVYFERALARSQGLYSVQLPLGSNWVHWQPPRASAAAPMMRAMIAILPRDARRRPFKLLSFVKDIAITFRCGGALRCRKPQRMGMF